MEPLPSSYISQSQIQIHPIPLLFGGGEGYIIMESLWQKNNRRKNGFEISSNVSDEVCGIVLCWVLCVRFMGWNLITWYSLRLSYNNTAVLKYTVFDFILYVFFCSGRQLSSILFFKLFFTALSSFTLITLNKKKLLFVKMHPRTRLDTDQCPGTGQKQTACHKLSLLSRRFKSEFPL